MWQKTYHNDCFFFFSFFFWWSKLSLILSFFRMSNSPRNLGNNNFAWTTTLKMERKTKNELPGAVFVFGRQLWIVRDSAAHLIFYILQILLFKQAKSVLPVPRHDTKKVSERAIYYCVFLVVKNNTKELFCLIFFLLQCCTFYFRFTLKINLVGAYT